MTVSRYLVMGANGFVGHLLCQQLVEMGIPVRAALRSALMPPIADVEQEFPGDDPGYFFSTEAQRNFLALTGACVLLDKALSDDVDGFEEVFAINYIDIDLCPKVWQRGFRNVYTAQAKLYHFESRSREGVLAAQDIQLFRQRCSDKVSLDPYYNRYLASPRYSPQPVDVE